MVDPAVSYPDNRAFNRGMELDIFLKRSEDSVFKDTTEGFHVRAVISLTNGMCVVWSGDSFSGLAPSKHWRLLDQLILEIFDPKKGVSDGLWIDMNELSNFCDFPGEVTWKYRRPRPPAVRPNPPPIAGPLPHSNRSSANVKRADNHGHKNGTTKQQTYLPSI
ncbi:hypothetical protein PAAG_05284 [Paracoccidioides lutzii Pb01]|uniref:Glycoside hydrolase family 31 TIM barrel domain-containing protein n=1 Tax=Paracoccidioides lutzii (strain ATCC MYA-826 / Pb01) TaxID=502779 RepID=C1H3E1_PARBA|nr:hypothetical protein PAAG_05284 [Paracoccidioides lutzii Pb01]EEH34235.2 hypothetical protein PAAG_05284 [Paracoccidioides lutzii Pb01]